MIPHSEGRHYCRWPLHRLHCHPGASNPEDSAPIRHSRTCSAPFRLTPTVPLLETAFANASSFSPFHALHLLATLMVSKANLTNRSRPITTKRNTPPEMSPKSRSGHTM